MSEFDAPAATTQDAFHVTRPLHEVLLWIKILAWVSIVSGAIQCLTIIGAVIGWLPIWIGVLALRTARGLDEGFVNRSTASLRDGMEALGKVIKLQGILFLIGVCLSLVYLAGVLIFVLIAAANN